MYILSNMYEFSLTLEKFYNMAIVAVEYVFLIAVILVYEYIVKSYIAFITVWGLFL